MIRVLIIIAVAGFLVSIVSLSTALAIGGPDLFTASVWNRWVDVNGDWGRHGGDRDDYGSRRGDGGSPSTRELAWTGGDTLDIDVPADITYTQAPGAGKLTVSGPQRTLDDLVLDNGHLHFTHRRHHRDGDLTIVMTAPAVSHFDLKSAGRLAIEGYSQDKLSVDLSGDGTVSAKGRAQSLALSISGAGATDFTELKLGDADVEVDGSGEATLAPTGAATIDISGSGGVTLLTRPAKLESNVSGSGSLHQKEQATTPPEPAKPKRGRT
jgi:hypothetical protein